ncbi:MAG: lipocalin family protein [Bacteroidetes bacterium]|jgi:hypothetical protein|nr:lipocalin family protein [Bacteroidota bacterium]
MKKLNIIPVTLSLIILMTITSCEKDSPLINALTGEWEIQELTVDIYKEGVRKESHTEYLEKNKIIFRFEDGGSGSYYKDSESHSFTWTLNDSILVISNLTEFESDLQCEVTINGSTLIISYEEADDKDMAIMYEYILTGNKIG